MNGYRFVVMNCNGSLDFSIGATVAIFILLGTMPFWSERIIICMSNCEINGKVWSLTLVNMPSIAYNKIVRGVAETFCHLYSSGRIRILKLSIFKEQFY